MKDDLLRKIIETAYGEAPLLTRWSIKIKAKISDEVNETLTRYSKTAAHVKNIEKEKCPDTLVNKVLTEVNDEKRKKHNPDFRLVFTARRFAVGLTALAVIVITTSVYYTEKKKAEDVYTQEQIELAEKQTKEALAIVGKLLNNSKNTLKEDVLYKQVGKPLNLSFRTMNYLFKKGEKI